jgi:hypothetical protein
MLPMSRKTATANRKAKAVGTGSTGAAALIATDGTV